MILDAQRRAGGLHCGEVKTLNVSDYSASKEIIVSVTFFSKRIQTRERGGEEKSTTFKICNKPIEVTDHPVLRYVNNELFM